MVAARIYKKVIIFRALQLGDLLCAVPAFRALRRALPHAHITLVGLPWASAFVARFNVYFDRFLAFPGYPGLPEQPVDAMAFTRFLDEMQHGEYDLAIQMQGNGSIVNPMVALFNAKASAGFCAEGHYYPSNGLYIPYPDFGSEINRHLLLMRHLGIDDAGTELEFPLSAKDWQDLEALRFPISNQQYVCVHPGSRGDWRQWPPSHFAELADRCMEMGIPVVITGTADELPIVKKVCDFMEHKPIIAAGKTTLGAVAALIKQAALLISNCTGVAHIASAFKTPSIVISMDGEPERWAPLDQTRHCVLDWTQQPDKAYALEWLNEKLTTLQLKNPSGMGGMKGSESGLA